MAVLGAVMLTGLAAALTMSGPTPTRWTLRGTARSRVQRLSMSDSDDADTPAPGWDMSVLQERIATQTVSDMVTTASNWRSGTCEQKTVLILEDWVRRLRVANGVLACGTYLGDVVLTDLASGAVVQRWEPEDTFTQEYEELLAYEGEYEEDEEEEEEGNHRSEVTCLDFDGIHVSSGHASGALYLRDAERCVMRGEHAGVVTGVHWDGRCATPF